MTELTTAEVLARLAELGRPISRGTWSAAVSRKEAPQPRYIGRTPLWKAADVDLYGQYRWTRSQIRDEAKETQR